LFPPLPEVNYGHPGELRFRKRNPFHRAHLGGSTHGDIGVSPSATHAHAAVLLTAKDAGVDVMTDNPYEHISIGD
jgi:hypothetical protein